MPNVTAPAGGSMTQTHAWARLGADLLTYTRAAVALYIAAMAWREAPLPALHGIVILALVGWSTDLFDGPLARYSGTPPSRIGLLDMWVDLLLHWCTALALALAGWVPLWALAGWAAGFALTHHFHPTVTVRLGFAAPLAALPIGFTLLRDPPLAQLFLLWLGAVLLLRHRRLPELIAEFVAGLPAPARAFFDRVLPHWIGGQRGVG